MSKKTKVKKTKETKVSTTAEIKFTKTTDDLKFVDRGRATKFKAIIEAAKELKKEGEKLALDLGESDAKTIANTRNWLANLIRKHVVAPKGTKITVRTTEDESKKRALAIVCEKAD